MRGRSVVGVLQGTINTDGPDSDYSADTIMEVTKRAAAIAVQMLCLSIGASEQACLGGFVGNLNFARAGIAAPVFDEGDATPRHLTTFVHREAGRYHTQINLYRKFHDYAWNKILLDGNNAALDTVPEELTSNTSPSKGPSTPGANVVANIRSVSQFPYLDSLKREVTNNDQVLRLARSAFLETQTPESAPWISPMTIHVLNFVMFPSPCIQEVVRNNNENGEYLGLPIFGADIVSLPGNKHLVAIDFQPVLPLVGSEDSNNRSQTASLLPTQYAHFESKLQRIHSKYQSSKSNSAPLLLWGGDIPPQAKRFFSPYALWTRLGDENAMETVNTVVWDAFLEYNDLYLELMKAVQDDVNAGNLRILSSTGDNDCVNPVWKGQMDYLEYRRTNDPARPMLQRLYGNEWSERVISEVLFPGL